MNIANIRKSMENISNPVYLGQCEFDCFSFSLNPSTSLDRINEFKSNYNCVFPSEYESFLKITNGIIFFNSGDFRLYSLAEIKDDLELFNYKKNVYPIGCFLDDIVVINGNEINSGKYIYVGDNYSNDEFYSLNCDFLTFFDRLIVTNINNFWQWFEPNEYLSLR